MTKLFSKATTQDGNGMLAYFNISLLIAKSGKPHTIGEKQIIPAISELIRTVIIKQASDVINKNSFSNNTVQIRIDKKAQGVED